MSNPYVQKFAKAFTTGLFVVAFVVLVILAVFLPETAHSAEEGNLPVVCLSPQEFQRDYQNGDFEIVGSSYVVIFPKGEPVRLQKIITSGQAKGDTIIGTWLVDNQNKVCLVTMENIGKQVKM